jgi:hypothetical protein
MPPESPAFEIGFVLAGAISAGCYSAGVMDFMIEALDDYYAEREKPEWDGPGTMSASPCWPAPPPAE